MPTQKDLKRRVRARMQKTGESYTAARARLLEKKKTAAKPAAVPSALAPSRDLAAIAGMSDEAVRAKTGKGWKEWVAVLDALGAAALAHRDIAQRLYDLDVPGWWAQMITVGYERIRGLREKGQRRGGGYEVGKSKTFAVPVATLYAAFGEKQRERWLGTFELTVRRATASKSLRARASDGTPVEVYFTAKGAAKSQVALQHRGLASKAVAAEMRALWTEKLGALGEHLAAGRRS